VQTIGTAKHNALIAFLAEKRRQAQLRQIDVAKRLREHQSWVARIESGQRRVDVIEFLRLAKAIGFSASDLIKKLED